MSRKASQPKATPQVTYSYFNPLAAIRQILFNTETLMSELDDLNAQIADLQQAQTDEAARQQAQDQRMNDQVAALDQQVADLQAQIAAGGLSADQSAAIEAAAANVKAVADALRAEQAA